MNKDTYEILKERVKKELEPKPFEVVGHVSFMTSREDFEKGVHKFFKGKEIQNDDDWYDKAIVIGRVNKEDIQQVWFIKYKV